MRIFSVILLMSTLSLVGCGSEEHQSWVPSPDSEFMAYAGIWYGGTVTDPSPIVRLYRTFSILGLKIRHDGKTVFACTASEHVGIRWVDKRVLQITTGCSANPNVSKISIQESESRGVQLKYEFEKPDYPLDYSQKSTELTKKRLNNVRKRTETH